VDCFVPECYSEARSHYRFRSDSIRRPENGVDFANAIPSNFWQEHYSLYSPMYFGQLLRVLPSCLRVAAKVALPCRIAKVFLWEICHDPTCEQHGVHQLYINSVGSAQN